MSVRRRKLGQDAACLIGVAGQDLQVDGQGAGIRERLAAMTPDSWREIRDQLVEPLSAMTSQPIDVPGGAMLSGVR